MTTCQICGREIKANTGTIALHGYTRPRQGWQTASCYGAKHLPYEVSCDAIPSAIEKITAWLVMQKELQSEFLSNPPVTLTISKKYPMRGTEEVSRPEAFDKEQGSWSSRDLYSSAYSKERYRLETEIKFAAQDLAYMQKRLADWKPPSIPKTPADYHKGDWAGNVFLGTD